MNTYRSIYIVHEYGDKSHFKALYEYAHVYGYEIRDVIILSKYQIFKQFVKGCLKKISKDLCKETFEKVRSHFKIRKLKNQVLIVGIAPYDKLLNKYATYIKRNKSFYFTSWPCWDGSFFPKGTLKNKEKFENLLKSSFEGAFCVNQISALQLKPFFRSISVVNHAIDVNAYKKKKSKGDLNPLKYVYVGSFDERKNILLILNWLENNPSHKVDFSFIGRGPLQKKIEDLSNQDSRIHLVGFLSKESLQKKICDYNFLVLPSKEEPFGIVLIEALAAGVPCIVSDAPGPKEIIKDGENGFVFALNNQEENFDEVMQKSANIDSSSYEQMHHCAMRDSLQYDACEIVKKWICLL